jgi:predicted small secreted protein
VEEENKEITYAKIIIYILFTLFALSALLFACNDIYGWGCKIQAIGEDRYCANIDISRSNRSSDSDYKWVIKSHKQDAIDSENYRISQEKIRLENEIRQKCYDDGKDYNFSFDIKKDYNFSCKKIEYINDHFIDKTRQMDGGYISGYFSGLLSYGYIQGQLYEYVTERILATGQLVQNISYHLDCNNVKSNEQIDYYTESKFVMYYVEECIK